MHRGARMKKSKAPQTFGFVLKHHVPEANRFAQATLDWLTDRGCKVLADSDAKAFLAKNKGLKAVPKAKLPDHCDMVLVFGGDGTFLSMARHMVDRSVPMLGINLGHLGFLTEISVKEAFEALERILKREYAVQERALLHVSVLRGKQEQLVSVVLNDAVLTNGDIARILDLQVSIDGVTVASIKADGMIVSTPTGSTAYSLAAGGPIVHPAVAATTLTAICPHSLTIRPIVVPDQASIELKPLKKEGRTLLTLDGQAGYDLKPGDIVRIKRHKQCLRVVRPTEKDYFELLRNKLKLGARGEET